MIKFIRWRWFDKTNLSECSLTHSFPSWAWHYLFVAGIHWICHLVAVDLFTKEWSKKPSDTSTFLASSVSVFLYPFSSRSRPPFVEVLENFCLVGFFLFTEELCHLVILLSYLHHCFVFCVFHPVCSCYSFVFVFATGPTFYLLHAFFLVFSKMQQSWCKQICLSLIFSPFSVLG